MPRFTMFSTGGHYTKRELAELNRRYEACMAKVIPRDRDALVRALRRHLGAGQDQIEGCGGESQTQGKGILWSVRDEAIG